MTEIQFRKYVATGNDFIIVWHQDITKNGSSNLFSPDVCRKLCDRNNGIGADGILYVSSSADGHFNMAVQNADGSEAKNCGNGLRSVVQFLMDQGLVGRAGIIQLAGKKYPFEAVDGHITIQMGIAEISVETLGGYGRVPIVYLGNQHVVMEASSNIGDADALKVADDIWRIGKVGEANIGFVSVQNSRLIDLRVVENGVGLTKSCGSGACAAVAALVARKRLELHAEVEVRFPGGRLSVKAVTTSDEPLWEKIPLNLKMTGPAVFVFAGQVIV